MEENYYLFYCVLLIISYILTQKLLHKLQNLPPSPFPTIPILGHIHLLKGPGPIHRTLVKVSAQYGPAVTLQLGSRRAVLVSSASVAEDCLGKNDVIFANRPRLLGAKILSYEHTTMLWASYGPLWRNHRRIAATEILSPARLHLLSHIRSEEVRSLIGRVENRTVEVKSAVFELMNNVMMRMIAGKRFYGEETEESDEAKRFKSIVKELLSTGGAFCTVDLFPALKYLGVGKVTERGFKALFGKLDGFFQGLVDEQRRNLEREGSDGDCDSSKKKKRNLIEVLLELQKSDPAYFTDNIIKGLVQILLLAGTETSASTMEWAIALLLNHPEVFIKARKEIDNHIGVSYDRLVEEPDLDQLPYLHCIINETLRMYPAAPILPPHESSDNCIVGGYRIPKGTMLMVNVWAIQNDPKVWDEPERFKPERFENVGGDRVGYKFMPFGSGRRACPGENLAMRMIGLTLATMIQCFDWERVGEVDMEEMAGVSMWKAKPLQAKFWPRKDLVKLIA